MLAFSRSKAEDILFKTKPDCVVIMYYWMAEIQDLEKRLAEDYIIFHVKTELNSSRLEACYSVNKIAIFCEARANLEFIKNLPDFCCFWLFPNSIKKYHEKINKSTPSFSTQKESYSREIKDALFEFSGKKLTKKIHELQKEFLEEFKKQNPSLFLALDF